MSSTRHDEVRDYRFADKALALRERADLTQGELASLLGVSSRAIQTWEAGEVYPGTARLQQLIALYLERDAFETEREQEEAAAFWSSVREKAARRIPPFDPLWFASLRRSAGAVTAAVPTPAPRPLASVVRLGRGPGRAAGPGPRRGTGHAGPLDPRGALPRSADSGGGRHRQDHPGHPGGPRPSGRGRGGILAQPAQRPAG